MKEWSPRIGTYPGGWRLRVLTQLMGAPTRASLGRMDAKTTVSLKGRFKRDTRDRARRHYELYEAAHEKRTKTRCA